MKTLRCLVTTFIPLFFSAPYALSWQDQYQVKGIYPFRVPPLQGRFSVSSAWPLWSSAVPASPAHSPKESENVHTNCRPKRKTTESTAKCIGGMDILHEDDAVIALNKPAGIRVVPSPANSATSQRPTATKTDSVIERVLAHYKALGDSFLIPETLRSLPAASDGMATPDGREPLELGSGEPMEGQLTLGQDAVVHRLDQGTSGVLLLAKTADAASSLRQQFRERRVKKIYFAVTQGMLKGPMTVTSCIGRDPNDRRKMQSARQIWGVHGAATRVATSGKLRGAVTLLKPLLFNGKWSVVQASPVTGRTHQIRLHLQMLKTPLIGDPLYGDASATSAFLASAVALRSGCSRGPLGVLGQHGAPGMALPGRRGHIRPLLHAAEVCFIHPRTAESLLVRAPLPPDMRGAIAVVDPHWPTAPELSPFAGDSRDPSFKAAFLEKLHHLGEVGKGEVPFASA